jgi:predicted TIM-barrel fold metal-dependent hydrolase
MNRRSFLQLLTFLAVQAKCAATGSAQAAAPSVRRFIDVHCHFFNAADLPVRGFLQRVVLTDYALGQNAQTAELSVWRGLIAKLADYMVKRSAPSPKDEISCLSAPCAGFPAISQGGQTRSLVASAAAPGAVNTEMLANILQSRQEAAVQGQKNRGLTAAPQAEDADVNAFVDFVLKEMDQKDESGAQMRTRSLSKVPAIVHGTYQAVAAYIQSGKSKLSRYFNWAGVLSGYRAKIAVTYLSLYDAGNKRLVLAAPALVDYDFWLRDFTTSPISQQIEVMATLSLQMPKPIHGFAPFDPLRETRHVTGTKSALEIAQDAVLNRGFLGVKLYSPMGFRPSGNAETGLPFPAFVSKSNPLFGQQLDEALDRLYAWCEANDVPILAHTADSQAAGPEYASRAQPRFWRAVLQKYPKLKLNLAHFGNFSQAFQGGGDPLSRFERTWEYEIGTFVKSGHYPNVYADIAYFYWVLEGSPLTENIKAAKAMFKRYISTFDPKVERLMFGTDWSMTGKADGFEHYIENVEAFFRDIGLTETQLDNLFYRNAVRFLGLKGNTRTMARLGKFYRDNGKKLPEFA